MQAMRIFLAAPAGDGLVDELVSCQDRLRPTLDEYVKWERMANLHLTLKFIGDVQVEDIQSVFRTVKETAAEFSPAVLVPRALDAFPRPDRARVVVMGLDDPEGIVGNLAKQLDDRLLDLGYAAERHAFKPHITLARARRNAKVPDLTPTLASMDISAAPELYVDAITVYESDLGSRGATYTVLAEEPLGMMDEES